MFNEVNQELEKVHDLSDHIDQAENTKAAVDLNSRIAIELAYIQMESLKMQSIVNQQLAEQTSAHLYDQAVESQYRALPKDTKET